MTAAAPSGVVTFLFTDVEGSTRRWESDAQAMRAALVVHDKVLRTAIEAYDGFLFSHTGDGFVAAFASPMSAVNAAVYAQRELQLPVRMGLATGEAELRDGDYFGTVLLGITQRTRRCPTGAGRPAAGAGSLPHR
jgi:class 3 adenylate cyclase